MSVSEEIFCQDFTQEERFLLQKALRRLSCYDDTPRGLYARLVKLTYKKEAVDKESCRRVVKRLMQNGLLDERSYAENLLSALRGRGYGPRRILDEFYKRKFSEKTVSALAERLAEDAESEEERAFAMLSRRAASRRSDLSDLQEKQRLYGYLLRLGFSSAQSRAALDRLTEKEEENA